MRSKGFNAEKREFINPGGFQMSVGLYSATGKQTDISQIITGFRVYESIFQNALIAEIDIADGVNLLEGSNITGNEIIATEVSTKKAGTNDVEITKNMWYVLDLPLFGRPKPDAQAYTIRCISPFGMLSKILRTEATYRGSLPEIIAKMYAELGVSDKTNVTTYNTSLNITDRVIESIGVNRFVPARMTYQEAIELLLSKIVAPNGAPAFAFETFNGFHRLESYNDFYEKTRDGNYIDSYVHGSFYAHEDQTENSFEEKRKRILEISSNLGFSPYKGLTRGAYVTRIHQVDWGIKSYVRKDFNAMYEKGLLPLVDKDLVLHPEMTFNGYNYTNLVDTHNIYLSKNTLSGIDVGDFNIHENVGYLLGHRKSIIENMEQLTHTVRLHGDPRLRPGAAIQILLPAINMQAGSNFKNDELLSGNYIIASTTHKFTLEGYFVELKLKKDSVNRGGLSPRPKQGELSPGDEGLGINKDGTLESPVPRNAPGPLTSGTIAGTITGLNAAQTAAYLNALSDLESSGDYSVTNQYNYIGKYQMGAGALIDLGYVRAGTSNNGLRNPANWTGKGGISSQEDFLSTPAEQEKAIIGYTNLNYQYLASEGVDLSTYSDASAAGILASAHNAGAGGTADWVKSNGANVKYDGNNTANTKYYDQVGGAVAGASGGEEI